MQEAGGVRGRYLPQAMLLPQEHAIALTIGRIIIWGTVNAIPQRTLEGLMSHNSWTSANLGDTYHGAWYASIFSGMATLMCERLTRSRFNDPPMNLPFPQRIPSCVGWHNIAERCDGHPNHSGFHGLHWAHCVRACGRTDQQRVQRHGRGCIGSWGARAETFHQQESTLQIREQWRFAGIDAARAHVRPL